MQKLVLWLARLMAVVGGVVLSLLILLTCVSVLGRSINTILHMPWVENLLGGFTQTLLDTSVGPVTGDFELVEAGIAFAIFAFLPLCQITGGHASVDIFTSKLSPQINRVIQLAGEVLFAFAMVLIAWKLYDGMLGKMRYNETTFLLQFPVWWAYALSLFGAVLASIVAIYVAGVRLVETFTGRTILTSFGGAEH